MTFNHTSVMLKEAVEAIMTNPNGIYIDCTLGGGGHSRKLAENLSTEGLIIGIDQDEEAIKAASEKLSDVSCQIKIIHSNFRYIDKILEENAIDKVDGVLFDLGVSSHQIDTAERGFSYMHDAPLDMRMDREQKFTAFNVLNEYDENHLSKIFHEYGEERFARRIASEIVKSRKNQMIKTTGELVKLIERAVPSSAKKAGHPAKRVFQAIRIEVNNELDILSDTVAAAVKHLKIGGRIAVITFHSLEDRIIKNKFKELASDCICPKNFPVCTCNHKAEIKIIGKTLTASEKEITNNSRSKSAKLRVAEKIL